MDEATIIERIASNWGLFRHWQADSEHKLTRSQWARTPMARRIELVRAIGADCDWHDAAEELGDVTP